MTEERLKAICEKFGPVQAVKLKTAVGEDGQTWSRGSAQVFYQKKEDAGVAMQKLYYE